MKGVCSLEYLRTNPVVRVLHGAFVGVALVLPGLSAGTVMLILGFYRDFIDDISSLRLKPYLPLLAGALAGGLAAVYLVGYLLDRFQAALFAFLLGMLLASVPAVLNLPALPNRLFTIPSLGKLIWPLLLGCAGFATTWFVIREPALSLTVFPPGGLFHFFVGGAIASATMLLPGVSGSAVLVIMNLYDDVIFAVSHWQWLRLAALAAGFAAGLFGLSRLLSALYRRYRVSVSFLLAGLIVGSTRVLLPSAYSPAFFAAAAAGALLVLYITHRLPFGKK